MNFINKERPYYTVNDYYLEKFHEKVYKISLNGDFTCPNRDGTISSDGCIYCSESGSAEFGGNKLLPLKKQFEEVLEMMQKKWKSGKYIAYFQANTNTYGPIYKLKSLFEEALTLNDNIVGLSIATRPDCLSDEIIDYLADLNNRTFLTIEIGLQTIHESTARLINRGHTLQDFENAVVKLRKNGIHVVCHIINGLPSETKEMMMDTLHFINKQDIQGLKIHMLYVIKNTPLERYFIDHPFPILSLSEYTELVADQIEQLRPDIVLHRLTGDAMKEDLIVPLWTLKKFVVTNEIDKILRKRKTYQGYYY
jgi:hypothetical protein